MTDMTSKQQNDPDIHKGAIEGDRPEDEQIGNPARRRGRQNRACRTIRSRPPKMRIGGRTKTNRRGG